MKSKFKKLSKDELKQVNGGTSRAEYCAGLANLITGGGYQGDLNYAIGTVFHDNCGSHGYALY
jgi:bacteriocin-like protein